MKRKKSIPLALPPKYLFPSTSPTRSRSAVRTPMKRRVFIVFRAVTIALILLSVVRAHLASAAELQGISRRTPSPSRARSLRKLLESDERRPRREVVEEVGVDGHRGDDNHHEHDGRDQRVRHRYRSSFLGFTKVHLRADRQVVIEPDQRVRDHHGGKPKRSRADGRPEYEEL